MSQLASVQAVGINTDFIRDQSLSLVSDSGFTGGETISLEDGTPLLKIEKDLMSASHRIHFIDAKTDQQLFEMRKERFHYKYYAEHPEGNGKNLFDVDIESAFMGGPTAFVSFPNIANGGNMVQFEYKIHSFDSVSQVVWEGQTIAEVERKTLSRSYTVQIAPRVDPLPILAMIVALTDRARKKKGSSGIAAGAPGGAAGAGGC